MTVEHLRRHRVTQRLEHLAAGFGRNEDDNVFSSGGGAPLDPSTRPAPGMP